MQSHQSLFRSSEWNADQLEPNCHAASEEERSAAVAAASYFVICSNSIRIFHMRFSYSLVHLQDWLLYCIVFKYLYSSPQQPWANIGAFGSISSKKRDKF